jgi:hypothetical protein
MICIPDSSVASLIGRGGRNVETIERTSHTSISVIDKIPGLKDRVVKVEGLSADIQSESSSSTIKSTTAVLALIANTRCS